MPFLHPARTRLLLRCTLGLTITGIASYRYATYGQTFHAFDDTTDPLALSGIPKAFNPHGNRTLSDVYVARVPLKQIEGGLLSDDESGGRLVERYVAGLFGGWAFAIQRQICALQAGKSVDGNVDAKELFSKEQIMQSRFDEGTTICNELQVIWKTPTSILFRGGSPPDSEGLKEVDVLLQGLAEIDTANDEVVFRLKCMFYAGNKKGASPPLPEMMMPLHLMYARAMAANGVANCRG